MASNCIIHRDNKGDIIKVDNPYTGKESKLFNEIAKIPHVESLEQAVRIYDEILKVNPQDKLDGFVSNSLSALFNLKDKNPKNIKGWINQLTDVQKNGGIRNVGQELDWIGLQDYLNEWVTENKPKNGNIPLNIIEDYVKSNQIEIVEVSKGTENYKWESLTENQWSIEGTDLAIELEDGFYNIYDAGDLITERDTLEEAKERVEEVAKDTYNTGIETKYAEYQLEGGENYREILLTLPKGNVKESRGNYYFFDENGRRIHETKSNTKEEALQKGLKLSKREGEYKSSHWDESNILAHIRLNERTLPSGERVLFIEEVQSDWSQEIKKKGVRDNKREKELESLIAKNAIEMDNISEEVYQKRDKLDDGTSSKEREILQKEIKILNKKGNEIGKENSLLQEELNNLGEISDSPYKKTDQWVGMAMRKVYQMAAQEGFDRVAWVTGEQSADRYDLSKQVDNINWANQSQTGDAVVEINLPTDRIKLLVDRNSGNIKRTIVGADFTNKNLEDVIGKDLSKKILSEKAGDLKGDGLKVGGEGMKTFYNSILPKVAKKEAQRLDKKAKVDVIDFNDSDNKSYFETVDIEGDKFIKLMVNGEFAEGVFDYELEQQGLEPNAKGAKEYLKKYIPQYTNAQGAGQQLSVPLTNKIKEKLVGGTLLFSIEDTKSEYDSIKTALKNTKDKYLNIVSNGKTVVKLPTTVDQNTKEGLVNSLIKDGAILPEQLNYNGELYYQIDTNSPVKFAATLEFLKQSIHGKAKDVTIKIDSKNGLIKIEDSPKVDTESSVEQKLTSLVIDSLLSETKAPTKKISESNLRQNLFKILNDMGISVSVLKGYKTRHKLRNGKEVSVTALADVANRLVAFRGVQLDNGQIDSNSINLEDLTEEVMHFIVETFTKEQLESLSDFIKNSPEYKQHYTIYNELYKGNKELLEKEVLGKIMQNIVLGKTEGYNKSFWNKVLDLIEQFFSKLNIQTKHFNELKFLNKTVEDFVIQQNKTLNSDNLQDLHPKAVFNSAQETRTLYESVLNLKKATSGVLSQVKGFKSLGLLSKDLDLINLKEESEKDLIETSKKLNSSVSNMINILNSRISFTKDTNSNLNQEDLDLLEAVEYLRPLLNDVKTDLQKLENKYSIEKLIDSIESVISNIANLESNDIKQRKNIIRAIADDMATNLNEEEKEYAKEHIENAIASKVSDTSAFFSFFGQLQNSRNSLHKIIAYLINKKEQLKNIDSYRKASVLQDLIEENGLSDSDISKIMDENNRVISNYDWGGYIQAKQDAELSFYNSFMQERGKAIYNTFEEYEKVKQSEDFLNNISLEDKSKFTVQLSNLLSQFSESPLLDEYRENRDSKLGILGNKVIFEKEGITETTQEFMGQLSSARYAVINNSIKNEGLPFYTPKEVEEFNIISKTRKKAKSISDMDSGNIKKGIVVSFQPGNDKVKVSEGIYIHLDLKGLTEQQKKAAIISYDLHKFDNYYKNNLQKKQNVLKVLETGSSSNVPSDVLYNILLSNTSINLSNDYYENLPESVIFSKKIEELNEGKDAEIAELRLKNIKLKELLNLSRRKENPIEVDVISSYEQDEIIRLNSRILEIRKNLQFPEKESFNENFITDKNDSYKNYLEYKGIKENTQEELKFLIESKHSAINSTDISYITKLYDKKEAGLILTEKEQKLISAHNKGTLLETQLSYATSRIQPYFKRTVPKNYISLKEYKNKGVEAKTAIRQLQENPYIQITVNNERFFEDSETKWEAYKQVSKDNITFKEFVEREKSNTLKKLSPKENKLYKQKLFEKGYIKNPDYKDNVSFQMPRKGKFKVDGKEYNFYTGEKDKFFGIDNYNKPTKNVELYNLRRGILDLRQESFKDQNSSYVNIYDPIQVSATKTQQARDILNLKTGLKSKIQVFKNSIKESLAYRVDDVAYGVTNYKNAKVLPKYYTKKIENKQDVSTDHYMAMMFLFDKSSDYKAKSTVLPEISAVSNQIYSSKRNGKGEELKHTIEMTESFIDSAIYGQQERTKLKWKVPGTNFEADFSKIARVFTNYIRLKNLGFKATTAITGGTTGHIVKKVDEFIGQTLNRESARLGRAEFKKFIGDTAINSLKAKNFDDSSLYVFMQWVGDYNITDKARNAQYGMYQKHFSNSAMSMYAASDFAVTAPMALGMVQDFKIYKGKIYDRLQFIQRLTRDGMNEKEAISRWENNNDRVYNYINLDNKSFKIDESIYEKVDKKNVEESFNFIRNKINKQLSKVKGQIPQEMKVTAQRHALGTMVMMHKGYASILGQDLFKSQSLNYDSGQLEEGKYVTLYRLISSMAGNPLKTSKDKNIKKSLKEFFRKPLKTDKEFIDSIGKFNKSAYNSALLDWELRIRNAKRLKIELTAFMGLGLLFSLAFMGLDDDEMDDIWAAQFSSYILHRTLNESSTNLSFGLLGDLKDTISSPFSIHMQSLELFKFWNAFNGDVIESNKYKGLSKRQKYLIQNSVLLNSLYELNNAKTLKRVKDSYNFFAEDQLNWVTLSLYDYLNNPKDGLLVN